MRYYKVDLDGSAYTYGWDGDEPLSPGDEVTIPGNVVNPEPTVRTVIRELAEPDYDRAKIKNILAKTPRRALADLDDLMDDQLDSDRSWFETNPGVVLNYPQKMVRDEYAELVEDESYDPSTTYESPDAYGERG